MQTTTRYFLKKEDKLKSRKAIDDLFKNGKTFSNFPFKIIWLPANQSATLQAGFAVSSRNFKKAVDRNRIKRLVREAWRLQKNDLQDQLKQKDKSLSVFFVYIGRELPLYDQVYSSVGGVVKRLIKWTHEESPRNN